MSRRKAERRGRIAEWAAMAYLMCKGYRILGHRLRTPYGEVDVAAWKDGVLVIVEVKARATYDAGAYAVTPRAQTAHRQRRDWRWPAAGGSRSARSASISWSLARDGCQDTNAAPGFMSASASDD